MAGAVITGEKEKDMARLEVGYAIGPDCEVYGVTVLEKKPWRDW